MWEDVQFSYQIGREYRLAVVAAAKAAHIEDPTTTKGQVQLGKTQITNWVYFVKSNNDLSLAKCLWGCIGRTAVNLVKGSGTFNLAYILRAWGNFLGLIRVAANSITISPASSN